MDTPADSGASAQQANPAVTGFQLQRIERSPNQHPLHHQLRKHLGHVGGNLVPISRVKRCQLVNDVLNSSTAVATLQNRAGGTLGLDDAFGTQQEPQVAPLIKLQAYARGQPRTFRQPRGDPLLHVVRTTSRDKCYPARGTGRSTVTASLRSSR
jgi:hypothetical protein